VEVPKHLRPLTCLFITTASTSGPDISLSSQILLPSLLSLSLPSPYLSQGSNDACEAKPLPQQSRCRSPRALLSLFVPSLVCPPPPLPPYLQKLHFVLLCSLALPRFHISSHSLPLHSLASYLRRVLFSNPWHTINTCIPPSLPPSFPFLGEIGKGRNPSPHVILGHIAWKLWHNP